MENQIYRCNRLLVRRRQITSALPFLFNVRWGWVRQNSLFLARLQQLKFSRIQELVKVKFAGRFSQRSFCLRQVCYLISWADRMTKSLRRLVLQLSAMKRYDFGTVSKAQNLAEKLFFWENSMFMLTFCQRNDVTPIKFNFACHIWYKTLSWPVFFCKRQHVIGWWPVRHWNVFGPMGLFRVREFCTFPPTI